MGKGGVGRNRVRIIGGEHRGRLIGFDDGPGLRPTGDRVRETLFNWLKPDIPGSLCLDLFAGSGALGFEAVSRGALRTVMLDQSLGVVHRLGENARTLGVTDRVQVIRCDTLEWLAESPAQAFDIVFVDPPFASDIVPRVLGLLEARGWLSPVALVYLEQDSRRADDAPLPEGWERVRAKRSGQVDYCLLRFGAPAAELSDE